MDLQGRTVVVTGGSQGIGEQLADGFASAGATVLVVARSAEKLAVIADRIGGHWLVADLSTAEGVDGLVASCIDRLGHIDVWVNNAGLETSDGFVDTNRDLIRTVARLNFEAPMMLTRDVAAHMAERGSGHIVQMSSVAGAIPFPGLAAYSGTKAGLTHLTETVRLELAGTGINFTVVAPGPVDTPMWDRLDDGTGYAEPALQRFRQLQFLPKLDPKKVASETVAAVQSEKRFVRLPKRYAAYHALNNAPRRLVEGAMAGVKLPAPALDASTTAVGNGAASEACGLIWATDNPPSRDWPLYTRGNVGEVFPKVVLPLTWDLFGQEAENGWRAAYRTMGLLQPDDLSAEEPMVILSVFGGYCYINASYVRVLGVRAPGGTVEAIDSQFFGESDAPGYRAKPGDKNLRSSAKLARTVVRLLGTKDLPGLRDDQAAVETYLRAAPPLDATDDELLSHVEALAPLFERLFERHIDNTFSLALLSGAVADLLAKIDETDALVSILGGIGDVESAAPSFAMWALARRAVQTPAVNAAFDQGVPGVLDRIDNADWLDEFADFLAKFGSRGPNEWDMGSDPWAFRPDLALTAIDRMRTADESNDPALRKVRLQRDREAATARVRGGFNPVDRFQFDKALAATTLYSQGRERSKTTVIRAIQGARVSQAELARRIADRGGPAERWKTCLLSMADFRACLADPTAFADVIDERAELHGRLSSLNPPFIVDGVVPGLDAWESRGAAGDTLETGAVLQGIPGCPGIARGTARVILDPGNPGDLGPGDVLIAPITDPSWTPLFLSANAVVVDVGATMSHAVIVSRELGIPCVVSAVGATTTIPDGATLEIDGNTGTVTVIDLP